MNQIKFGVLLNYLSIVVTFFVGIVYTPILIRLLGQTEYGIYSLAFAFAGYLTLLDLGIGNSIVRYISQNQVIGTKDREARLVGYFFKFFCCIGVLTFSIGFWLSQNIHTIISNEFTNSQLYSLKWMIFILTINFAFGFILNTFSAVLHAYQQFIYLRLMNIISKLLIPILTILSLMVYSNVIVITIILMAVNTSVLIINYFYYKKKLGIKMSFAPVEKSLAKEILGYSSIIFIVAIADKLYWQTDQALLGILSNPDTVAIYAISIQMVMIFMSLSTAVNGVFLPKVTHIVSEDDHLDKLNKLYIVVSKFQTFVIGLVFSCFILIGEAFISLWVGPDFKLAYLLIVILMSTFAIDLIQNLGITVMQAKAKYKFRAYVLIICSILNIIISIPIIQLYGSVGTAIVTAVFVFLGNVLILNIYFHKVLKLNMISYWKHIGKMIIVIVVVAILGMYVENLIVINNWLQLFAFVIIYAITYSLTIYIVYLSRSEKSFVSNQFKKLLKRT